MTDGVRVIDDPEADLDHPGLPPFDLPPSPEVIRVLRAVDAEHARRHREPGDITTRYFRSAGSHTGRIVCPTCGQPVAPVRVDHEAEITVMLAGQCGVRVELRIGPTGTLELSEPWPCRATT